jgi:hypothetical protein
MRVLPFSVAALAIMLSLAVAPVAADELLGMEDLGDPERNDKGDPRCKAYRNSYESIDLDRWKDGGVGAPKTSCKSATVNARGAHTTHLEPCTFKFYQIKSEKADDLAPFAVSTACFDEAVSPVEDHPEVEEYVSEWPDECVADFARCYHLERDEKIYLKHVCKKEWKVPEGALLI